MSQVKVKIKYNLDKDSFKVSGNCADPYKLVEHFLRGQIGAGVDNSKAEERKKYKIIIKLDTTHDQFYVQHNCGNKGLRDGILQRFLTKPNAWQLTSTSIK